MKKLLILCLILGSATTFGQQKVYQRAIFDAENDTKKMKDNYPNLSSVNATGKIENPVVSEIETRKLSYDFLKFARSKNVSFSNFSNKIFLPTEILFNKNGTVDYFVYGIEKMVFRNNNFKFDTLSASENQIFVKLAEEFCKDYSLKLKSYKGSFRAYLGINFGKDQRKTRKNNISTLEMAENCTQPDTVKSLILNKLNIEIFPKVVFRFKNLEKLDLSDNYIENVPSKIWELKKLKSLTLSGNYLNYSDFKFKRNKHLKDLNLQYTGMTQMPKSLKRNRKLEILFVGNNLIEFRKRDFAKMSNLKALNLYNVRTTYLPKSIAKLQNLTELDLYHNDLKQLPKEICSLKNLYTLAVANNQLWNLPDEISKMPNLKMLYAHHNRLNSLPNLPNLKLLDVGYNIFKVFPEQVYDLKDLEEFDITNNEIQEVPEKLLSLKNLQKVYIRGNDFFKENEKSKEIAKLVADLEQKQILVR